MANFSLQQSCLIFVENKVKPFPKVQSTAIIVCYGAPHLDQTPYSMLQILRCSAPIRSLYYLRVTKTISSSQFLSTVHQDIRQR